MYKNEYVYDFGDQWEHDIVIEKIVETEEPLENPKCIKAKMESLPKDCGGTYGYDRLLKILSNLENSEYQEMVEWLEETTYWNEDRDYVNIEEISEILGRYKEYAEFILEDFMM